MDDKERIRRIKRIDMLEILRMVRDMQPSSLKLLTDNFKEPLVRLLLSRAPQHHQHSLLFSIKEKYVYTNPTYYTPSYFKDLQFDIDCGIPITELDEAGEEERPQPEPDAKLVEENKQLKAEVEQLKAQLAEALTLPQDITAKKKVRMELALRLMEKAGINKQVLERQGNKDKAGELMGALLDIPAQSCKQHVSVPGLNRNYHKEIIKQLNPLLKDLNCDIQL